MAQTYAHKRKIKYFFLAPKNMAQNQYHFTLHNFNLLTTIVNNGDQSNKYSTKIT
jgi:hypothetical protein